MFITDSERRSFPRMTIRCTVLYKDAVGQDYVSGQGINLSAQGVLFTAADHYVVGELLDISVIPDSNVTPPLNARIEIIRARPVQGRGCEIAGVIREIRAAA